MRPKKPLNEKQNNRVTLYLDDSLDTLLKDISVLYGVPKNHVILGLISRGLSTLEDHDTLYELLENKNRNNYDDDGYRKSWDMYKKIRLYHSHQIYHQKNISF